MRGPRIAGQLLEGELVEVPGRWHPGQTLQPKKIRNLVTGQTIEVRGTIFRNAFLAFLSLFVVGFVIAFIATLTTF
jgi:hypothetical protein